MVRVVSTRARSTPDARIPEADARPRLVGHKERRPVRSQADVVRARTGLEGSHDLPAVDVDLEDLGDVVAGHEHASLGRRRRDPGRLHAIPHRQPAGHFEPKGVHLHQLEPHDVDRIEPRPVPAQPRPVRAHAALDTRHLGHRLGLDDRHGTRLERTVEVEVHHVEQPGGRRHGERRRVHAERRVTHPLIRLGLVLVHAPERKTVGDRHVPVPPVGVDADPVRSFGLGRDTPDGDRLDDLETVRTIPDHRDLILGLGAHVDVVAVVWRIWCGKSGGQRHQDGDAGPDEPRKDPGHRPTAVLR